MKKYLIIILGIILAVACNSKKGEQKAEKETVYEVGQFLNVAADNVDKAVTVAGNVTHTCKHSGRRCFIVGEDPNVSIRVEAKGDFGGFKSELIGSKIIVAGKGDFGGFKSELIGSKIIVEGIAKERRLSKEYIDQMEEKIKEKQLKEDGSAESCQAEMNNINKMREWMKANNKDYYSIFYIDGESYKVTEE